jgi:hypothetical protein
VSGCTHRSAIVPSSIRMHADHVALGTTASTSGNAPTNDYFPLSRAPVGLVRGGPVGGARSVVAAERRRSRFTLRPATRDE